MVTKVLPELGFDVVPLFYSDLIQDPHRFVRDLSLNLGLKVPDTLIENVVTETSPQQMKQIQSSYREFKGSSKEFEEFRQQHKYSGLTRTGQNSRKVRKASVRGYEDEISSEALNFCKKQTRFHLPDVLLEKFDLK